MDVKRKHQPVGIVLDKYRLVTALEEVAAPAMPPMEAAGVGCVEPFHGRGKVGLGGSQEEMVVVSHQAKGENVEVKANRRAAEKLHKVLLVLVIKKNRLPIVPPRSHMIHGSGKLNSPRTRHAKIISKHQRMSTLKD